MSVVRFRSRRRTRTMEIVEVIFASLKPKVDAPAEILSQLPDLAPDELFEAFSRAHHVLNNLQREILSDLGGDGGSRA